MEQENTFVDIRNTRTREQIKTMKEIIASGDDPFAKENLSKYHKAPILKEGEFWSLTTNQWSYGGKKHHFMAIYNGEKAEFTDNPWNLPLEAHKELYELFGWVIKEYGIRGGAIGMRFGDTQLSGASIMRLHAHLIEPDFEHPNYEPATFFIGGTKQKEDE